MIYAFKATSLLLMYLQILSRVPMSFILLLLNRATSFLHSLTHTHTHTQCLHSWFPIDTWPPGFPGLSFHFQNPPNSISHHAISIKYLDPFLTPINFNSRQIPRLWPNTHLHTAPMATMAMMEALMANTTNGSSEPPTRFMTTTRISRLATKLAVIAVKSGTN